MSSSRAARALSIVLSLSGWSCADRPAPPAPQGGPPRQEPVPPAPAADAGSGALEACVDGQLAARALNPFGDAAGTVYAGGTPLFDETAADGAGRRRARVPWVLERHPEIAKACAGAAGPTARDLLNDR